MTNLQKLSLAELQELLQNVNAEIAARDAGNDEEDAKWVLIDALKKLADNQYSTLMVQYEARTALQIYDSMLEN